LEAVVDCISENLQRKFTKLDAINFHFALYSLPLLPYLPRNTPLTFTFHGPWALESTEEIINSLNIVLKRMIEQTVYRQCDRFIVLSKAFGTVLYEIYQVPWHKIRIIPDGVDTSRFQPTLNPENARLQLYWPQDRPILFTPRRLVHRMGLDKLIGALVAVKKIPEVWLAIAGKGPLRETLEQQVRDLNLEENVKFLGFLPDEDLPVAYQAANLTVMPSQSLEGFGLLSAVRITRMWHPCTLYSCWRNARSFGTVLSSLVTESADENAIAECLIDFLIGRLELPSREACREYAMNNFDWKAIATFLFLNIR
jgi:glycosyltransferase involved in cell wall biosynthesis